MPHLARERMLCSSTGRSPIGTSGLGITVVYGRKRVPRPPARITALMPAPSTLGREPPAPTGPMAPPPRLRRSHLCDSCPFPQALPICLPDKRQAPTYGHVRLQLSPRIGG